MASTLAVPQEVPVPPPASRLSPCPPPAPSNVAVGCSGARMGLGGQNTLQPLRTSSAAILAGKCRLQWGWSRSWERRRSLFQEAGTGERWANYGG